jgi:HlyD family secretion protein
MQRRWLTLSMASAVALGGAIFVYARAFSPLDVQVAEPESNVEVRVFGVGTVEAQIVSKIGFQIGGRIVSLSADQGDVVALNTELAALEDSAQRARVAKAQVANAQAEAALARTRANLQRSEVAVQQKASVNQRRQSLVGSGAVTREAADDAQANEAYARSDNEVAKADVLVADAARKDVASNLAIERVTLDQHRLVAPFDGRVLSRLKEIGTIVAPGEAVFSIVDPRTIWVRAYVDEALAGGLAVGQTAWVRLRSEPSQRVEAEVVRIDAENDRITEERRLYVRCRACNPQHQVRYLGEQAEVEIVKGVIPEGLFAPLRAMQAFDGRSAVVWTLRDGRLGKRRVALGERLLDGRIAVAEKLADGEMIVVSTDASGFREGRSARVRRGDGK